jgi:uncharacterized protein YukE
MSNPDLQQTIQDLGNLHYPDDADAQVRQYANLIGAHGILHLLDTLRVFVGGDIRKVLIIGDKFAQNSAFTDAVNLLNEAKLDLQARWHGDAADQFTTYATTAVSVLSQNQAALKTLMDETARIATVIINNYKDLLLALARCASNLAKLGGSIVISFLEATVVPPIAPFKLSDIAEDINSAFKTFWDDCSALLGSMISNIGAQTGTIFALEAVSKNFAHVPDLASTTEVVDDPTRYRVKPGADHP